MLDSLSYSERLELLELMERRQRLILTNKLRTYYPDTGPLRRELYPKHLAFFAAGAVHRERCFMAANRVGKTEGAGGYEVALHLTGLYPDWWEGRRFDKPVNILAAGDTAVTTRDIIQTKLLGPFNDLGTGLIPGDLITGKRPKSGIPNAVDIATVKHVSGGESLLQFRAYSDGRETFQGTERDVIWLDEEPPMDVYTECLLRTMTTNGIVLCTFTPLSGLTEVALAFLPNMRPEG